MGTGGWRMPIVGSPHGSLEPYPDLSLAELMVGSIDRWGDRVALVDGVSGAEYDFRALGRAMQVVGGLLRDDGVEPGDRVAIVAPNSTEWIAAFLGIQAAGAAVTTLSPLSRRREVEQQFADSKPSAVFVGGEATTVVRTLWGSDERIYDMSSVWQMVVQGGGRSTSVRTAPGGEVAVVAYSSGTTGMPKGVMLTNRNLVANVHQLLAPGPLDDSSVMVDFLPFSHIYGMVGLMACGLVAGARQVVMPGFDPLLFARLVEEHQATNLFVVPPVMLDLAQGLEGDWSSVTHVMTAAAPVSAHVVSAVEEACGARVYEGYGLTEASPATNSTMCGPVRFGTVGQPLPDTLEMVVDVESGRAVAFGEVG
ncbi:MAG TPA: AMP-binding protein, partial [Acidimicrobiales bacterium]|nr:AMP-binding protein [Acidimicrobiales bacterium]